MKVRPARSSDIARIQDIERLAGEMFRATEFAFCADHDADPAEEIEEAIAAGLAWVAVDGDDRVDGMMLAMVIPEGLYLKEIDVDPAVQRRGIGRALIAALAEHTRRRGADTIWLRTFRTVPWNAPFYAQLGFEVVSDGEPASIADSLIAHEIEAGFDVATRCTMRMCLSQ